MIRAAVLAVLVAHSLDKKQSDVWLPMIRCQCGAVMPSNRYRGHLADEITEAVQNTKE